MNRVATGMFVILTGCMTGEAVTRTAVGDNALGVTALETSRSVDDGTTVLTLTALAANQPVGSIRFTVGHVADLAEWSPDQHATVGAELVAAVGDRQWRMVTLETHQIDLAANAVWDPAVAQLVDLVEVRAALALEHVIVSVPATETAYIGPSYPTESAYAGAAGEFVSPMVAGQACMTDPYNYVQKTYTNGYTTYHVNALTAAKNPGDVVLRQHLPSGASCKASDGVSACGTDLGVACTYGPSGFKIAQIIPPPAGEPYGFISESRQLASSWCTYAFQATAPTTAFPNVTGSLNGDCGCCANGGGLCCGDSACAACSGTAERAEIEAWDY